jgi:hypothetical protein
MDKRRGVSFFLMLLSWSLTENDFVLTHLQPIAVFPSGNERHFKNNLSPFVIQLLYQSLQDVNWCSLLHR